MFSKPERPRLVSPTRYPSRSALSLPNVVNQFHDEMPACQICLSASEYHNYKAEAEQSAKEEKSPAEGPNEAKPASRPTRLVLYEMPRNVPGAISPAIGEVGYDIAKQQANEQIQEHWAKRPAKQLLKVPECIELSPMGRGEIACAGDDQLEEIVVHASADAGRDSVRRESPEFGILESDSFSPSRSESTENTCWVNLPICPGEKTICEWISDAICYIVTCAPIRKFIKCCCLFDAESENSGNRSLAFEYEVNQYIARNPGVLTNMTYTMSLNVVEDMYFNKIRQEQDMPHSMQQFQDLFSVGQMDFRALLGEMQGGSSLEKVIFKLADSMAGALRGNVFRLYKVSPNGLYQIYALKHSNPPVYEWKSNVSVDTQCLEAVRRSSIMKFTRVSNPLLAATMPYTVFQKNGYQHSDMLSYEILVPVLDENSEVAYMIDIWRNVIFGKNDLEVAKTSAVWGSLCIIYFTRWTSERMENDLNRFLLDSVQSTFEDVMSIDQVVEHTLQYAQKLVDADRASLFMVDRDNQELVSRVFDLRGDGSDSLSQPEEIRIPIARGIAGHVATTGETVNIANAYADERFNDEVDEATGYCTTSILCMPVKVERKVIGVVQMVNKRSADRFSSDDERSFNIFSAFFGLALHNARIYDMIARNEQKYRVALDVLSYHNTCREHEMHELQKLQPLPPEVDLNDFYLDPFKFNPLEKCQAVMIMFNDLFSLKNFDHNSLTRFVLTVKKNYREVPYHNFHHGWSVAQSMYAILKADTARRFSYKQRLALFVASLCHDLDHRGYTNKYMSETASPLASMYTTSTLEHHHFGITVTILQQDGHNIFDRFNSEEYKYMLGLIKTCILATDLAAFFPNLAQLQVECKGNYDWSNNEHRKLAMALSMTAADLSAAAKPWDIQIETVKVIFQEFYDQGDKERKAGKEPIPMMDRDKPQEQPASQVGFITSICLPCYGMLQYLLPETDKMLRMAEKNLEIWQAKASEVDLTKADWGRQYTTGCRKRLLTNGQRNLSSTN